ncbi:MAG: hypothetical protein BSOLF_1937 [Candidatus Carbobacillus altaicus]|uniref:Uncharacterized protein n=1 Tax=Candidatus Carbonibacillus altaicus TaxID=2163959 RepID=A0A2R6XYL0_9BACL|nr:MAG: hypothetical protein BSOLF_1937 [Candidatus Carbobacillus altaicus]
MTAIGVLMRVNGARIVSFEHAMGELPAALASVVQWHTCGTVEREEAPGVTVRLHEMYRTCRREDVLAALERGAGGGKDA